VEVRLHDLLDVGVLDLDRDLGAVVKPREMDLADRGRGDRALLELREHLARRADVLAQPSLDILERPRRHRVLKPLELAPKLLGQEVRHDRDQLTDLDEQTLQPDDRALDAARVPEVQRVQLVLDPRLGVPARAQPQPHVARDHLERREVGPPAANVERRSLRFLVARVAAALVREDRDRVGG
jgi:hypothetical protein